MFLTDLKGKLDKVQDERGNVLLSRVHVMHGNTTLVAHSDFAGDDPPAEAESEARKVVTIAEAEGLKGTLEERLQAAGITGIVSVTGEELQQLLEIRDEMLLDATNSRGTHGKLEADEEPNAGNNRTAPAGAAGKGPELVNMKDAEAQLGETMAKVDQARQAARREAAQQQPTEVADLEGRGKEVRMPCNQFDENKVACVLAFGHDGDHDFDPSHAPEAAPPAIRCTAWLKGKQCALGLDHEGNHAFRSEV